MPTVYKSNDASAPVLNGTVGSLVAVLDACLVDGYGSKAAAGWTKPYSGTNQAVYQQASAGFFLDVNDNAAGAGGAREATIRGYEAMTGVGTGTSPFPTTTVQASPGAYVRKSATVDSTARGWVLFADGRTFYLFMLPGDSAGYYASVGFGDFFAFKPADAYKALLVAHSSSGALINHGFETTSWATSPTSTTSGVSLGRRLDGVPPTASSAIYGIGSIHSTAFAGPNAADGAVYINRLLVNDTAAGSALRGYLRGIHQILNSSHLMDGDTFTGAGEFAGRTFTVIKAASGASPLLAVETTAWNTSS